MLELTHLVTDGKHGDCDDDTDDDACGDNRDDDDTDDDVCDDSRDDSDDDACGDNRGDTGSRTRTSSVPDPVSSLAISIRALPQSPPRTPRSQTS